MVKRIKRSLFRKSIRDMQKSKAQFISIFIMATLSVTIVTGLDSVWKTIEDRANVIYAAANTSDLWVNVVNPTEKELWSISRIKGVEKVEKRFTMNAIAELNGSPTLRVYAISARGALDRPKLQQGSFSSRGGAILDEAFAKEHRLKINDEITVKIDDKWISYPIEGLALSSEHIYSVKGTTTIIPDSMKYGFIIINEDLLKNIYGRRVYNQICVKLSPAVDISRVEAEIDKVIGDKLIGIVTRDEAGSVNNINANIRQFKTLATVFPLMFFLVTALITLSTMLRMVENQRGQIGVLKALGYSKKSILWHYTSYGVYMGLLGAFLGLVIGPNFFGRLLIPWLRLTFSDYRISVNYINFIFSLILILACTGGVSLYACLKLQRDSPSVLLRDKPPKEGSHIFLEYFPKLWNKMRFSRKLIARNTLKSKMRMIMSVLGITGCTGLIVAAFTLCSMVNGIAQQTYQVIYTYDQKIILDSKVDSRFINNMRLDGIVQQMEETAVEIICPDGKRKMKLLTVLQQDSPLVHLEDVNGNPVLLSQDGISVTRKLAQTLNIKVGDSIELKRADKSYVKVPIRQIVQMVTGQGMYMLDTTFKSIGETFKPTAILVKWYHQPDGDFLNGDYVDEYVDRISQIADIQSSTKVVYTAAVLLIFMGGILAFVVLYNSSILNFFERIRDLTTLSVLGFYQKEIRSLVLTENILSVIIGFIFGLPVGKVIADIAAGGLDDQMDLISRISLGTVAFAGIITFIFALVINRIVAEKMKNLNMLESLKSVE